MLPIVDSRRSSAPRLSISTSRWSSRGDRARPRRRCASPPPVCAAGGRRATRTPARARAARGCARRRSPTRCRACRARSMPECGGGTPSASPSDPVQSRRSSIGRLRRRASRMPASAAAAMMAMAARASMPRSRCTRWWLSPADSVTRTTNSGPSSPMRIGRAATRSPSTMPSLTTPVSASATIGSAVGGPLPSTSTPVWSYSARSWTLSRDSSARSIAPTAGTRRATIDASRCSDSSSPRSMWSRTLAAAGTKSASTASVATATIVARMRFLMPRCRGRAACRRGGSRCRGSWRCGWRHPTARRACVGCC